jgi:phosphoenolpyruvate carboxylase
MSPQMMPSDPDARPNRGEDIAALEADARLREDIRLLGRILGDTVRDQEGADVFDLVDASGRPRSGSTATTTARRGASSISSTACPISDRAHRPRLQLFLTSRQHRRRPEQHPADAGAKHRCAASGHAGATLRMRAQGRRRGSRAF